ncbi:hypothetical protein [Pontibacter cellulosilyticus]|uniref:Uncharacterized protein n=1 Tax=Pontibacter cellulosilyticus TaxID=1720253 RepID=A0A923N8V6_9BACT|nr:hypothetical protein [Pontibacter cellulosilyticus]MBC5993927.1 hypothetical protein [Pontibacter cellulosilyticus]
MIKTSVLAAAAALNGPSINFATPLQRTAKPNAPPGNKSKVDCSNRDLKAGEFHEVFPALGIAHLAQNRCVR